MRRRRVGSTSPVVEVELLRGRVRRARRARLQGLRHPAESPRTCCRACSTPPAWRPRCTATALVALDKLDKIGADGVERSWSHAASPPTSRAACCDVRSASTTRTRNPSLRSTTRERAPACSSCRRRSAGGRRRPQPTWQRSSHWRPRRRRPHLRVDPESRARAVVLHRRDHGGCRAGSGRQPRRRRPLRRSRGDVPRPSRCPRAGSRSGSSASSWSWRERGMFPAALTTAAVRCRWSRCGAGAHRRCPGARGIASRRRTFVWTCIRSPTSSASSSSTPRRSASHSSPIVGDDEAARGEVTVKNMRTGEQQRPWHDGEWLAERCVKSPVCDH